MSVSLRHVLWPYRYLIAIYLVLLALAIWMGGMVDAWDNRVSARARFLAPLGAMGGFMMLCCAWGVGYGLGDGALKALAKSDLRPWAGATVGLTLVTWIGFIFLLAWHGFPPDSLGQAARALIVFGTISALSFWWGLAARAFGSRWIWLLPLVLAVGWISGRVWGSLSLPEVIYQPVKNISLRHQAKAFLQSAHIPIALLGTMALGGCWWFRKFTINRFTPLFFTIPMFLISWLGVKVQNEGSVAKFTLPQANPSAALKEFFSPGGTNLEGPIHTPHALTSTSIIYQLSPPAELGNCLRTSIAMPTVLRMSLNDKAKASSIVFFSVEWKEPLQAAETPQLHAIIYGPVSRLTGTLRIEGLLHLEAREECARFSAEKGSQFQVKGHELLVPSIQKKAPIDPNLPNQCVLPLEWESWQPLPMLQGNKDGFGGRPSLDSLDLKFWLQAENTLQEGTINPRSPLREQSHSILKSYCRTSNFREFRFWPVDPQLKHAQLIVTHPVASLDIPFDWKFATEMEQ
jgi:hypothetical protein